MRRVARKRTYLTAEGRKMLAARLDELRSTTIPSLIVALQDRERDGRVDAEYARAVREASRIDDLVSTAGDVADLVRPVGVVALGDTVTIMLDSAERLDVMIVDPVEAPLDALRISSESPLSQGLLGWGVGAEVTVRAPGGTYRCVIIAIERP
jgi:transcription elongation GreA/GreB family factor